MKDRTNEEGFDPVKDSQVITASLRDSAESLRDEKHGRSNFFSVNSS